VSAAPTTAVQPVAKSGRKRPSPGKCKRLAAHLQDQYDRAVRIGNVGAMRYFRGRISTSFAVALVEVVAANKCAPKHRRRTLERCYEIAEHLNLRRSTRELVTQLRIEKPKGGTREVRAYNIKHRARRRIGARILAPIAATKIGADQYASLKGRGRDACVARIIELLEAKGARNLFKIAYVCDYKSCFDSMTGAAEWFAQQGHLSIEIAEQLLSGRHERVVVKEISKEEDAACAALSPQQRRLQRQRGGDAHTHDTRIHDNAELSLGTERPRGLAPVHSQNMACGDQPSAGPTSPATGLPQGASTSSLAAEMIIADVLAVATLPNGVIVVGFADDLVILARNERDAEEAYQSLRAVARRHQAGALDLRLVQRARIAKGLSFLGYGIKRRKGAITATPILARLYTLMNKLRRMFAWMQAGEADARDLGRLIHGWRNGLKHADTRMLMFDLLGHAMQAFATHISIVAALRTIGRAVVDAEPLRPAPRWSIINW
jgi:hypothetical protein